jgi:hypothetical protein
METERTNKILIPKDPESLVAYSLKIKKNNSNAENTKIAENLNSIMLFDLHEYFTISDEQASKDYDDPLDYCKKHINRISLFVNGITNRIINEITRKFVGQVTYFYSKNNMELEKHLAFDS